MVAREDVELACHQRLRTGRAALLRVDGDEAFLERSDVLLDRLSVVCRLVHLCLQRIDVRRVALERSADLVLEVVDDDEIGEEREDVLDFEQFRVLEEPHRPMTSIHALVRIWNIDTRKSLQRTS